MAAPGRESGAERADDLQTGNRSLGPRSLHPRRHPGGKPAAQFGW